MCTEENSHAHYNASQKVIFLKYINTLHYQQGKMKIKVDFLSTELECDKKL